MRLGAEWHQNCEEICTDTLRDEIEDVHMEDTMWSAQRVLHYTFRLYFAAIPASHRRKTGFGWKAYCPSATGLSSFPSPPPTRGKRSDSASALACGTAISPADIVSQHIPPIHLPYTEEGWTYPSESPARR